MCVSWCLISANLILIYRLAYYQDIAGTLATEIPEDSAHAAKLRSALESVDHKRRKVFILLNSFLVISNLLFMIKTEVLVYSVCYK